MIELIKSLLQIIFLLLMEIFIVGSLFVLRVMINWWLDIDYVEKFKQWAKNLK